MHDLLKRKGAGHIKMCWWRWSYSAEIKKLRSLQMEKIYSPDIRCVPLGFTRN
jgi:hypothetical protein